VAAAPQAGRALIERTVLDEQVAAAQPPAPQPWGLRSWLGPLLSLTALIVGSGLVASALPRHGTARHGPHGRRRRAVHRLELVLLAALVAFGRPLARRGGGWQAALGLDRHGSG
jgi:hypothetical protein